VNPAPPTTVPLRPGRSWRDIPQEVGADALSGKGRRRQILAWGKFGATGALAAALGWGGYAVIHSLETDRAVLAGAGRSEIVREISLITDGTLTKSWVTQVLALPPNSNLMVLDLPALRGRLLAQGQVRVVVLTRSFPDRLVVTLQERVPVARVQVEDGAGRPRQLVVAKDGVVYDGLNYDTPLLASLPWLDGLKLARQGEGYAPVAGMEAVADLLNTARVQAPHLYRGWIIVSLARLAGHDEIVVKSQDIPEIVFTRRQEFFRQLAQLDYVVDAARSQPEAALTQVNLALGSQVAVQFDRPADRFKQTNPTIILQPQRKPKRDL